MKEIVDWIENHAKTIRIILSLWLSWEIYQEAGVLTGLGFLIITSAFETLVVELIWTRTEIKNLKGKVAKMERDKLLVF